MSESTRKKGKAIRKRRRKESQLVICNDKKDNYNLKPEARCMIKSERKT